MTWTKDNGKFAKDAAEQALEAAEYFDEKKPLIDKFTGEQTNLQAQINQLVVEGDSSPEAAQARVGVDDTEYSTLKARLDAEHDQVTQQLAQTTTDMISIKSFGVKGDGTDETELMQNALDNSTYLYIADGTYYFSQLFITKPIKIIFGDKVVLKSDLNLDDATQGHIHVEGTLSEITAGILNNIKTLDSSIMINPTDTSNFKVGDIVELSQDRAHVADSSVTSEAEHIQQHAYAILTIRNVDSTTGQIDFQEKIPYDFETAYNPIITKVNALEGVELVGSNTKYDRMGVSGHGNFFHAKYTNNFKISGFECSRGGGKAVEIESSNRFLVTNIRFEKPTAKTTAKGEAILIRKSGYGFVEKCYIYDSRRGVDFANAWNCSVNDCIAVNARFTTHGLYARFINFNNCEVHGELATATAFEGFTFGNSSYMFDRDITVTNCKVYGGANGLTVVAKSANVKIINTDFYRNNAAISISNANNVEMKNCSFKDCPTTLQLVNAKEIYASNLVNNEIQMASTNGTIRISGETSDVLIDNLTMNINRLHAMSIESTVTNANIKIYNSNVFNTNTTGYLYVGAPKGIELYNVTTNVRLRLTSGEKMTVRNSKFSSWALGGVDVTRDVILKDNILTGVNGVAPSTPVTSANNNIFVEGNMYLFNA